MCSTFNLTSFWLFICNFFSVLTFYDTSTQLQKHWVVQLNRDLLLIWDSLFILNLGPHVLDRVIGFHIQCDCLSSEGLHKYLHGHLEYELTTACRGCFNQSWKNKSFLVCGLLKNKSFLVWEIQYEYNKLFLLDSSVRVTEFENLNLHPWEEPTSAKRKVSPNLKLHKYVSYTINFVMFCSLTEYRVIGFFFASISTEIQWKNEPFGRYLDVDDSVDGFGSAEWSPSWLRAVFVSERMWEAWPGVHLGWFMDRWTIWLLSRFGYIGLHNLVTILWIGYNTKYGGCDWNANWKVINLMEWEDGESFSTNNCCKETK